jgi:hypothetical protein
MGITSIRQGLGFSLVSWCTLFISNLSWAFLNYRSNKKVMGFDILPGAEKGTAETYIKEEKKM